MFLCITSKCVNFYTFRIMYYAVKRGRKPGVYMTWAECQDQVKNFKNCAYKKFSTDKQAWEFVNCENSKDCAQSAKRKSSVISDGIDKASIPANSHAGVPAGQSTSRQVGSTKTAFYAVFRGKKPGIYRTWPECQAQISGFPNASYHKFNSEEAAEEFMKKGREKEVQKVTPSAAKKLKVISDYVDVTYSGEAIHLDPETTYNVFTDGASSKNGQANAAAGIGVYWGPNHPLNVSQRLAGRQTNNRAEIYAATYALKQAKVCGAKNIKLYTDSQFMIHGITDWISKWKRNGWVLASGEPVKNKEDFIELDRARDGLNVEFIYIKAHSSLPGNTEADRLAVEGAQKELDDAFVFLT